MSRYDHSMGLAKNNSDSNDSIQPLKMDFDALLESAEADITRSHTILNRFPSLVAISAEHWVYACRIAFFAELYTAIAFRAGRENPILSDLFSKMLKRIPDVIEEEWIGARCMGDVLVFTKKGIGRDAALGLWILLNSAERPLEESEFDAARIIGGYVSHVVRDLLT